MENNDLELADVCRRIAFEIRAVNLRLLEISNSYNKELVSLCIRGEFKHNIHFKDLNSFFIYLSTHSFFIEMCTLRDYLAEFLAVCIFRKYPDKINCSERIRSMNSFCKKILPKIRQCVEVAKEIDEITNEKSQNCWLAEFSTYRNLIVHTVPLIEAEHIGFLVQRIFHFSDNYKLPTIYFPLPKEPFRIQNSRSKGFIYKDVKEWIEASAKHDFEEIKTLDVLNYCHLSLGKMMDLACRITKESPIIPKRASFYVKR